MINTVVARVGDGAAAPAPPPAPAVAVAPVAAAPAPPAAPAAPPPPPAVEAAPVEPPAVVEEEDASSPVSPLVRRMARENNVDLKLVRGTGAGNRISKQDVETFLASRQAPAPVSTPAAPVAAPAPAATTPAPAPLGRVEPAKVRVEPMSMMRQKIDRWRANTASAVA